MASAAADVPRSACPRRRACQPPRRKRIASARTRIGEGALARRRGPGKAATAPAAAWRWPAPPTRGRRRRRASPGLASARLSSPSLAATAAGRCGGLLGHGRGRLVRRRLTTLGDADRRAAAAGQEHQAGTDAEDEHRGHGQLGAHGVAARPGDAAPQLAVPGGAALGERRGLEDARLQVVARLDQRHHPHLARGAQARQRARAAGAAIRVSSHGSVRHFVELVVELV